jgi:hypothetical protein
VKWALHSGLLMLAAMLALAVTWADYSQLVPLRVPPGVITLLCWVCFAAYAVITTVLSLRAKGPGKVVAAHVLGAVTAPAVVWLLAIVAFGAFKARR